MFPIADHWQTFCRRTELTSRNVIEKDQKGGQPISKEHVENNAAVRKMLADRGVKPEQLPAAEDLSKVKRRIEGEERKIIEELKKGKKKK